MWSCWTPREYRFHDHTDAHGGYRFAAPTANDYRLRFISPEGFVFSPPMQEPTTRRTVMPTPSPASRRRLRCRNQQADFRLRNGRSRHDPGCRQPGDGLHAPLAGTGTLLPVNDPI